MNNMSKLIIKCPRCEFEDGVIQSLAEILPSGIISIRRSRRTYTNDHETTLVIGANFQILCGRCQTPVFQRLNQTIDYGTMIMTKSSFNAMIGTI